MTTELNFDDLTPIEIPVRIQGKNYVLREASGDAACRYRNAVLACAQLTPEGKAVSVRNLADVEPLLVSLCLFDEKGNPVSVNQVRKWPARVVKALYEKAKEISDLDLEEPQNKKENPTANEQEDTTVGSG